MIFSATTTALAKAIAAVAKIAPGSSTLPVLSHILLSTNGEAGIRVAATNLSTAVVLWLPANVQQEGAITLPAKLLEQFIGRLDADRVEFAVNKKTMTATITAGKAVSNIKGIDADDFPVIPTAADLLKAPDCLTTELAPSRLADLIATTTFAASRDESRPTLCGVETTLDAESQRLTLIATDGYRMALTATPIATNGLVGKRVALPPATLLDQAQRLLNALADDDKPVTVTISANQISFAAEGKTTKTGQEIQALQIVGQLVDAKFPDARAIIPKREQTKTKAVVSADKLHAALQLTGLFARDNNSIVRMEFDPDPNDPHITIAAASAESGDSTNTVEAAIEGKPLVISFNGNYMSDYLTSTPATQIVMLLTEPTRPVLMHPYGCDADDGMCVVMPMHPPK